MQTWAKDAKGLKNGLKPNFEQRNSSFGEKHQDKDSNDYSKSSQSTSEVNSTTSWNSHVKQKSTDSPKRTQSTVNSIIKSVFKIHQGNNASGDDGGTGKKLRTMNNQVRNPKSFSKRTMNEHEENNQGNKFKVKKNLIILSRKF